MASGGEEGCVAVEVDVPAGQDDADAFARQAVAQGACGRERQCASRLDHRFAVGGQRAHSDDQLIVADQHDVGYFTSDDRERQFAESSRLSTVGQSLRDVDTDDVSRIERLFSVVARRGFGAEDQRVRQGIPHGEAGPRKQPATTERRDDCVQVAGLVARRIVCHVGSGERLARGQRFGFIRFGSRVDLYLPLQAEPLVAIGRTQSHRPYDFRPPPRPKPPRQCRKPWRLAMQAKLETPDAKARYKLRKQTVEPVFGIIKAAMGFTRFHLRSLAKAAAEWTLVALAYNCRRLHHLRLAA